METFPLVAAAVLAGTVARLPNEQLNTYIAGTGILRLIYIVAYIATAKQKYTPIRSVVWMAFLGYGLKTLYDAGQALL